MSALLESPTRLIPHTEPAPRPGVLTPLHDSLGQALERLLMGLRQLDAGQDAELHALQARLTLTLGCLSHYRSLLLPVLGDPAGWPAPDPQFTLRHLARRAVATRGDERAQYAALLHHELATLATVERLRWPADEAAIARSWHARTLRTEGWLAAMLPTDVLSWLPLMADALSPPALATQLVALRSSASPEAWSRLVDGLRAPMGEARWQRLCAELALR